MNYGDVLDQILPRAKRLGLTDAETGQVDAVECELALLHVIQSITDTWDLDAFTVINPNMFVTQQGKDTYPLPDDFGRLIHPREEDKYGIFINDGSNSASLDFIRPEEYLRNKSSTNGKPARFTISQSTIRIDPPPDTNSSSNYTGEGVYIQRIEEINLDDRVAFGQASTLVDATIAQLGALFGGSANLVGFIAMSERSITRLVNHEKRLRQGFQSNVTKRLGRSTR